MVEFLEYLNVFYLGSIAVAWRLNDKISNSVEMLEAYKLVMKYLTATQVSPMEVAFVENSDPLATSVSADTLEVKVPSLLIEFENIPVERLDEVIPKMEKTLQVFKIVRRHLENKKKIYRTLLIIQRTLTWNASPTLLTRM